MLNQKTHRKSAVAIKRVIMQGDICICGICRKTYKDVRKANDCLSRCLNGHLNPSDPVVALAEAGGKKYRCHFCRRVYSERDKAVECAGACKIKTNAVVAIEHPKPLAQSTGGSLQTQKHQAASVLQPTQAKVAKKPAVVRRDQMHKFLRDGRKLICKKCGSESKTLDEVIGCYDSHPEKQKMSPQDKKSITEAKTQAKLKIVKTSPAPTENTPKVQRLTNEDEKFLRDGARYVCRTCSKKFFTREDVFACFDGHSGASQPAAKETKPVVPVIEAPVVEKTKKLSDSVDEHKFFRDGARYICRSCQKKHFTRGDVTTCFDSHPNAQ
jgi:hypothetical protein